MNANLGTMDRVENTRESTNDQQEHMGMCGCRGPGGRKRGMVPETERQSESRGARSALDILDERFARGEIDKDEYKEKKELISQRVATLKSRGSDQSATAVQTRAQLRKQHARRR